MIKELFFTTVLIFGLSQISLAQKAVSPAAKKIAVQLASQTLDLFPIQYFENVFKTKNETEISAIGDGLTEKLTAQVEESNLTAEKKAEVKAKIPAFTKSVIQRFQAAMDRGFEVRLWAKKSLEKQYSHVFALAELRRLNTYFSTENGKSLVKLFNERVLSGIEGKNSDFSSEDENLFMEFATAVKMPTYEKFTGTLVKNVMDDITAAVETWGNDVMKSLDKKTGESIKRDVENFVTDSLK